MTTDERITELAQDIYLARHNQRNDATGTDLSEFIDQTVSWVNQFIPEIEKEADWNMVRTNDDTSSLGTVINTTTIAYSLPETIRKIVINPHRDLTIRQDGTVVSTFKLVNPNQTVDPNDQDTRSRATVTRRQIIFSRPLTDVEVGGTIVADTISWFPRLSRNDSELLDLLDEYPDIRQLFVLGVVKNQILPDIVQGGLAPAFTTKYSSLLKQCVDENNASADASDVDRENFGWVGGVGF